MNEAGPIPSAPRSFRGLDAIELHADTWGDPANPPVLLLHGGGQTRHAWGETALALARRGWYAVALDQRGHGDSAWDPEGRYTVDHYAADLLRVVAALGRRPAVVGASLGGLAAMLAEGESEGGVFRAMVLVDITPRVDVGGARRIMDFMREKLEEGYASLEEAAAAVASYLPHRARPPSTEGLEKNLRQGPDGRWRWHWDPRFITGPHPPNVLSTAARVQAAARRLRLPTLLVRGRLSDLVSEEGAREFLAQVPHARFVDVSGAGHMVAGDRNDVFTDAVVEFLGPATPPG
jgi:pimeloyl-ACP methyl ester carboxylesterase